MTSIFCVVYQLKGAEWSVIGNEGWSQIYLTKNDAGDYRLIGWARPEDPPLIDCQITSTSRYKKRSDDFHRLVDSSGTTWGLGFYTKGDAVKEANSFHDTIVGIIAQLAEKEAAAALAAASQPRPLPPRPGQQPTQTSKVAGGTPGTDSRRLTNVPMTSVPATANTATPQAAAFKYSGGEFVTSPIGMTTSADGSTSTPAIVPVAGAVSAVAGTVVDPRPAPPLAPPPVPTRKPTITRLMVSETKLDPVPATLSGNTVIIPGNPPMQVSADYAATVGTIGRLPQLPEKPLKQRTASVVATMNVSPPFAVSHERHAVFDPVERKFKGLPEEWEAQINRSFGVALNRVDSIKLDIYPARVPTIMYRLREQLVQVGGLTSVGIFRVSPAHEELDRCRQLADEGKVGTITDPFTVAALIKMYLRELPHGDRVLDASNHDLISVCANEAEAWKIVLEMPEPHHTLFVFLLDLCVAVVKNQPINAMSAKNLGVCFAPNLFSPNGEDISSLVFSDKVSKFVAFAIEHRAKQGTPSSN